MNQYGFSSEENALVRLSKATQPIDFLIAIKKSKNTHIVRTEKMLLYDLVRLGLPDEVVNVILLYTFKRVGSDNINPKYALKLANDMSYKRIMTAENAVDFLRKIRGKSNGVKKTGSINHKTNVPSWSNPDYKDETTEEDRAKLKKIHQELLANLAELEKTGPKKLADEKLEDRLKKPVQKKSKKPSKPFVASLNSTHKVEVKPKKDLSKEELAELEQLNKIIAEKRREYNEH